MATTSQKIRLSIFLIVSTSILLIFFIVLMGSRLLKRMDTYYIVYENISVTGLESGAAVKYHGVQVGRVTGLAVRDAASIIVEIQVKHGTPIKKDTEAVLTITGITGLKFVELIGGTVNAENLPPRSTIIAGKSLFENISGSAEIIFAKLEQVLNNLNDMTGPDMNESIRIAVTSIASMSSEIDTLLRDNRAPFTHTMTSLDTVMTGLTATVGRVDSTVNALNNFIQSKNVRGTIADINVITTRLRTEVDSLELVETTRDLRELMKNANAMVVRYDLVMAKARDDILKSLVNLEETLENLRETTDVIRENPSVLLRGRKQTGDRLD